MVNYNKNKKNIQGNVDNESCSLWKKNNVLRNKEFNSFSECI
jgi:hypothetical protein